MMGGFTTYSTLAVDTVVLQTDPGLAISFALGSVAMGMAAAAVGIWVGGPAIPAPSAPKEGS